MITASHFRHKGQTYSVGSVVELESKYFDPKRMVKIEEAKPLENLVQRTVVLMNTETVPTEETHVSSKILKEDGCCGNAD